MKKIAFGLCLSIVVVSSVYAGGEEKKICDNKVDAKGQIVKGKDGKAVQICKTIKVHKKLEGTKVPVKK
jgi:hypothetical protein